METAIRAILPAGPGQRHRRLFDFARRLKASPHLAAATPADLKPLVRRWHARALPCIRTKAFDESWEDFLDAWERIACPEGGGSLARALQEAKALPLPSAALQYDTSERRLLVARCHYLQVQAGERPFYLSCRTAAAALGLAGDEAHVRAWRMLKGLLADGVLELVEPGQRGGGKAARYRYRASP